MATTSSFSHINEAIGLAGFCPELVQGTPNYNFTADGGANSGTAVTIDTTSGATHNNNIASITAEKFQGLQIWFPPTTATSALQGKAYNISAQSAPAANIVTLTVDTMAATPAGTDVFWILGVLPIEKTMPDVKTAGLPRDFMRLTLDPASSIAGLSDASGSITFEAFGLNTTLGDGVTPVKDRLSVFLETFYGTRTAASGTAVSGSGSTTTVVDVADASGFAVGQVVVISGEARKITAIDTASTPDNITLHRALSAAPADTTVVYGSEHFEPVDTGHATGTLFFLADDSLITIYGAIGSVKFSAPFGEIVKCSFDFNGEWDPSQMTDAASLGGYQLAKSPIAFTSTPNVDFNTTELATNAIEFDTGSASVDIQDTEAGGKRFFIRERKAMVNLKFRYKNRTPKYTWEANKTKAYLLACAGTGAGDMIGFGIDGHIPEPASMSEVNATRYWDAQFQHYDDQTANDAQYPRIIRA